ncbi:MAG: DEAD/DEAH box helicase [Burkholderiaceae bacterium]|nr:DEAD/DEAH box helicase [Burkholderiaceae bacterium]
MHFTQDDIRRHFDARTLERGMDYMRRNKVELHDIDPDYISAGVSGSHGEVYEVGIAISVKRHQVVFGGTCSCPMDYNCKHVAATLLTCLRDTGPVTAPADANGLPYEWSAWLQHIETAAQSQPVKRPSKAKAGQRLVFVLVPGSNSDPRTRLYVAKARMAADGALSGATVCSNVYDLATRPPAFLREHERYPLRLYVAACGESLFLSANLEPQGELGGQLMRVLLERQCLLWADSRTDLNAGRVRLLAAGPARRGALHWRPIGGGVVRLGWQDGEGLPLDAVLATEPAYYVADGTMGQVTPDALPLPLAQMAPLVMQAPQVLEEMGAQLGHHLRARGVGHIVPPPPAPTARLRSDIRAKPLLLLGSAFGAATATDQPTWHDYAILAFDYDGLHAPIAPAGNLGRQGAGGYETIVRDGAAEAAAWDTLAALGFRPAPPGHWTLPAIPGVLQLAAQGAWSDFAQGAVPRLRAQGWRIDTTPDYRYDLTAIDDWYAEVAEPGADNGDWFDLALGILIEQQRVPLLPVLLQLIREAPRDFAPDALAAHADTDHQLARLPDGRHVALPWGRIKPILTILGELYFTDRIGEAIRLPTLDAARLAELEQQAGLRWLGGERLRALGARLASFGGIAAITPPAGLQATLRSYQQEGLAWMQFLREFNLAGILADDMGLGKTIQTLSHILLEKEAGRLDRPALVVAPTSLMANWQAEAARFAPGLRVLLLHGAERQTQFEAIGQADLVLTTYALLPRDEAVLREQRFHLLILDESQYIKNSRAKAAQTARLLQARHRLCLTGTPLQNHLGELWSQFHFLLPGLLGDEARFNSDFRKPIERQADTARNALLIRRIKPFLLRRTKDKVATELPAKTEMVREVTLTGAQRDLYETVRLAMDRKVREAIATKGVARSQIVILDALLKLRQVCCDPRLVKTVGKKGAAAPSAKLAELMDMLDALLDEGRKVLVFSQFTSMLALIEDQLRERAVPYSLLTGDTLDRAAQVDAFQQGQTPVFLISLKAGGVGLNLTAADTVIHYDPWWNPAAENQATDRAWRIGQDKPVFVYKLIAKGTLEEKIQDMQRQKAGLADAVLAAGEGQGIQITAEDLQAIFAPL